MSEHRAPLPRRKDRPATTRRGTGRRRAIMSLGLVAVMAAGFSVRGTFAFWTDSATLQTGSFTAGTLDITLDGNLVGAANNGGTFTNASFALPLMVPGESIAYSFPVRNNGSVPLTYTMTGTGSGALAVANGMQYAVTFGAVGGNAATNTGTATGTNRVGSCAAATPVTPVDGTPPPLVAGAAATTYGGANRALAVGAADQVCIVARFSGAAPNALQGASGSAAFVFDAKQVGAP